MPTAQAKLERAAKSARRQLVALYAHSVQIPSMFHRFVRDFEPWGIFFTVFGLLIALVTILVELEDRQAERTFRAWEFVLTVPSAGSSRREAFEYLNREFDGFICGSPVAWAGILVTGNSRRRCLVPPKQRESLAGIEAAGEDLTNADLGRAHLTGASFAGADLTSAFMVGADLTGANLTLADIRRADLTDVSLAGANLTRAVFEDADLVDAHLGDADLSDASLVGANLTRAYLVDAILVRTDLTRANLTGALLRDADLTLADLANADLTDTDLTDADLSGAYLGGADLTQTQLDAACGLVAPFSIPTELTWRSESCSVNVQ